MADKRIYSLNDAPTNRTGYYLPIDKSGGAEALKVIYEDVIEDAVTAGLPAVTTPVITEALSKTVTTTVAKKSVNGQNVSLQLNFTLRSEATTETYIDVLLNNAITGTINQSLSCYAVITGATDSAFKCVVLDDSPFTLRLTPLTGNIVDDSDHNFIINGTLITT